jgi:hypothetical protein
MTIQQTDEDTGGLAEVVKYDMTLFGGGLRGVSNDAAGGVGLDAQRCEVARIGHDVVGGRPALAEVRRPGGEHMSSLRQPPFIHRI